MWGVQSNAYVMPGLSATFWNASDPLIGSKQQKVNFTAILDPKSLFFGRFELLSVSLGYEKVAWGTGITWQMKLSRFRENILSSLEIPKFYKAGPLQTGSNASRPTKKIKSQTLFWRVLGIQSSWILLNMVNHSTTSHFQKELEPLPHPTWR